MVWILDVLLFQMWPFLLGKILCVSSVAWFWGRWEHDFGVMYISAIKVTRCISLYPNFVAKDGCNVGVKYLILDTSSEATLPCKSRKVLGFIAPVWLCLKIRFPVIPRIFIIFHVCLPAIIPPWGIRYAVQICTSLPVQIPTIHFMVHLPNLIQTTRGKTQTKPRPNCVPQLGDWTA